MTVSTTDSKDRAFIVRVLDLAARSGCMQLLRWQTRVENGRMEVAFAVDCTDLFSLGVPDVQALTPDNVVALEKALADVLKIEADLYWGWYLFAARVRNKRPRNAAFPDHLPALGRYLLLAGSPRNGEDNPPNHREFAVVEPDPPVVFPPVSVDLSAGLPVDADDIVWMNSPG